jgi:hypothetical protein
LTESENEIEVLSNETNWIHHSSNEGKKRNRKKSF